MLLSEILLIFAVTAPLTAIVDSTQEFLIGGLFDSDDENEEIAFELAVNRVNDIDPYAANFLIPEAIKLPYYNVFSASKTICNLLQMGTVAVFGPTSPGTANYIQSVCDSKEMPHVEYHWNIHQKRSHCLVNLYPYPFTLGLVFVDIVRAWNWGDFLILYENSDGLSRVSELLRMYDRKGHTASLKQLEGGFDMDYRSLLISIKRTGINYFVIDCEIEVLEEVLKQAQQVGLMTENQNYIITNLDMHTIDLAPYQYGGTNITGVRLVNPENPEVIRAAQELQDLRVRRGKPSEGFAHLSAWKLRVQTALMIDAVQLFYEALDEYNVSKKIEAIPLYCNTTDNWEHGFSLINFMKSKTMNGLTGLIKFDNQGFRSDISLEVVELSQGGLITVGTWNSSDGFNISRKYFSNHFPVDEESLQNKSLVVIIALTPPYGMLKETTTKLSGNDRFEGIGIDLIDELSVMLGFNYTFIVQADGANGNLNRTSKAWNGMIREVMDGRADLAITDLTVTFERESAVDFTMPFMNLGISILYRKPEPVPPSLFTFASPFSLEVWLLLGASYCLVSLSLFVMGRISPSEWTNPYPCIEEPEFLINQLNLRNSLWFTVGSLMQQGSEIAPVGISTRMVAGIWWFFTLIMVSSYTANLAAFLTVETLVTPFKNIDELSEQKAIQYGAKKDGATSNFFRDSDNPVYKKIWHHMESHPGVMTLDNDEGVKRVEDENYAFFMESTTIEYIVERHCGLARIGNLLDDKGYGIAMKKDSKFRNSLSAAVVKLQESGKLTALKIKWWKEKRGAGNCDSHSSGAAATPLDLSNLGGVFFVLGVGAIMGFIGTFVEMTLHVLKVSYKEKISFKDEVIKELKIFTKFKTMTKPGRKSKKEETDSQRGLEESYAPNYGFAKEVVSPK